MPGNPFVGAWSCIETESQAFPDSTLTGIPRKRRYLVTSPKQGQIVVALEGDAGSCALPFSTQYANAMLVPGQSCQSPSGAMLAYTSGTATVSNQMLTMDLGYDISEATTTGVPGRNGTGIVTDHCTP